MTDEIISMYIMYKPMRHIPIKTFDIFQVSLDIQCHDISLFSGALYYLLIIAMH